MTTARRCLIVTSLVGLAVAVAGAAVKHGRPEQEAGVALIGGGISLTIGAIATGSAASTHRAHAVDIYNEDAREQQTCPAP